VNKRDGDRDFYVNFVNKRDGDRDVYVNFVNKSDGDGILCKFCE
jgi:hypothetical protein